MAIDDDPKVKALTNKAYAAKSVAEAASVKASDFGARSFAEHTAYGQAISANEAAQKAWNVARVEGHALTLLPPFFAGLTNIDEQGRVLEEDATARIGELAVARKALFDDMAAHAQIVVKDAPPSDLSLTSIGTALSDTLPDFSTWQAADYAKSAAFGGAGGLAGYLIARSALGAVLGSLGGLAVSFALRP